MCGIAGILNSEDSSAALQLMISSMTHRGPDDYGTEIVKTENRWIGLGHRRLAILDLSLAGHQPMVDPDTGNIIVFNGEIYNHLELRKQLPSQEYKSASDTETLLYAYRYWKEGFLDRLVGMFSIAIWNAKDKYLLLARDRLGVKPLYILKKNKEFSFASELRPFLVSGMAERRADKEAIESYLTFGSVQEPKTILADVEMLPPGTIYIVSADGNLLKKREYWSLSSFFQVRNNSSLFKKQNKINRMVRAAVSDRLISDAPLGAFLSGGIDSSVIVGMMAQEGIKPETFCLDFDEGNYREGKFAEIVADEFNCNHHNIVIKPPAFLNLMDSAFDAMDQPTCDGFNSYFISGITRNSGLKVALSGQGGDEVFAGYPSFRFVPRIVKLNNLPSVLTKTIPYLISVSGKNTVRLQKIRGYLNSGSLNSYNAYAHQRSIFWDSIREKIMVSQSRIRGFEWIEKAVPKKNLTNCPINQISQFEISCYLRNTLLRDVDVFSMAHSLEVRVPLLDHRLVELVAGIEGKQKLGKKLNKYLLVRSLKGKIPDSVTRRKKGIFWFPWDEWLRRDLKSQLERIFHNKTDLYAMAGLNKREIAKIWGGFLSGGADVHWTQIWTIYVLLRWMKKYGISVD